MNALKSIGHGIVSAALFAIPLVLASHAQFLDLTIGGLLNAAYLHFAVR